MKNLVVDFDGVLHSYTTPWAGPDVIPDPPVEGAFTFLTEAVKEFNVSIYSSRSGIPGGVQAMQEWFLKHGLPSHVWESLSFPLTKPAAFVTLDDRAMCFRGVFPSIAQIAAFRAWNKPGATMPFSDVLEPLRQGARVRRTGWDASSWVRLIDFYSDARREFSLVETPRAIGTFREYLVQYTQEHALSPWIPTTQDLFADDWMVTQ